MSPRRAAGGQKTAFQHFHFVYSVRFIQKYLFLTLVPLAQALLNRQLAAFWQALRRWRRASSAARPSSWAIGRSRWCLPYRCAARR